VFGLDPGLVRVPALRSRPHTINFVQGKRTQMHHIAFELKDWAQVQRRWIPRSKNIDLAGDGRHGPGTHLHLSSQSDDQIVEMSPSSTKMLDESLGYFDPRPWQPRSSAAAEGVGQPSRHLGYAANKDSSGSASSIFRRKPART